MRDSHIRMSRKSNDIVAAPVRGNTSCFGQSHKSSFCKTFQISGVEGSIARHYDHTRSHRRIPRIVSSECLSDSNTVNGKNASEVCLNDDSNGIATRTFRQNSRRGTDTPLKTKAHGACSCSDISFGYPGTGVFYG